MRKIFKLRPIEEAHFKLRRLETMMADCAREMQRRGTFEHLTKSVRVWFEQSEAIRLAESEIKSQEHKSLGM